MARPSASLNAGNKAWFEAKRVKVAIKFEIAINCAEDLNSGRCRGSTPKCEAAGLHPAFDLPGSPSPSKHAMKDFIIPTVTHHDLDRVAVSVTTAGWLRCPSPSTPQHHIHRTATTTRFMRIIQDEYRLYRGAVVRSCSLEQNLPDHSLPVEALYICSTPQMIGTVPNLLC